MLPSPSPPVDLVSAGNRLRVCRVILTLPLCQIRGPSSTVSSPRRLAARETERTMEGGIKAVEEGTVGWW